MSTPPSTIGVDRRAASMDPRAARGDRPDRPGAAAAGRLRLRRHARAASSTTRRTAAPLPEAVAALRALAALPQTTVAVISGPGAARPGRAVPAAQRGPPGRQPRLRVRRRLRRAASRPSWSTLRTRLRDASCATIAARPARASGWSRSRPASRCTPAAPTATVAGRGHRGGPHRPGDLARRARHHRARRSSSCRWSPPTRAPRSTSCAPSSSASAVLFLGDDVTDENAFAQPARARTSASRSARARPRPRYRVADPLEAARVLGAAAGDPPALALRRAGGADRAALDARPTAARVALLTPTAKVTWLCHPRPDSPAVFADLLGGDSAGHFSVAPAPRGGDRAAGPALPARHDDGRDPLVRA